MGSRRRRRNRSSAPQEVTIESLSHEGRGITRINGKTVFVFGALPGERVLMQVQKSSRKFDQATTLEVIEASPQRVQPRCEYFQVCGGCSLQHMSNDDQVEFKQQSLLDMMRHASLVPEDILPPLRGPAWGYRGKARLGVKNVPKKGRVLVGFRERNTPYIADMRSCEVLLPQVGHRLEDLSALIGQLEARAHIPQIEVAADADQVQLVFRHLQPLCERDLELLRQFAAQSGFLLQLQPGGPDTVCNLHPPEQALFFDPLGKGELAIGFNALDFVQVNTEINRQMVNQALDLLELEAGHAVLDLFCGLGNFTLPMAQRCSRVTGVEGDPAMVSRARASALANRIDNTDYYAGDLEQPDAAWAWMRERYDRILLDPPRSGAQAMSQRLGAFGAQRIVYVSCQPSSLVRDAAIICDQGYAMTHVGVMDMFPQTAHVESMAVFVRKSGGRR